MKAHEAILLVSSGGLVLLLVLLAIYGWMLFAYVHSRYCRREELMQVLAAAADNDPPLAPAVRAYLAERPRSELREFWMGSLLSVLPFPFYYWIWHRRHNFDRKVERLAQMIEQGVPLYLALRAIPGVASRDMVLAAAIGETTGQLGQCLRGTARRQAGTVWIELMPQFMYPFVMLLIIGSVLGFLLYEVMPKFRKIFLDFGVNMPQGTMLLVAFGDWVYEFYYVSIPVVLFFVVLGLILTFDSTARWFSPGLGALYRGTARSRVLRLLSLLLKTGKPVPESMAILVDLPLGRAVLRRLDGAKFRIERGEPLAESLFECGLVPDSMVPLLHSSQRTGNLPWVLGELADSLYNRTERTVRRIMQAVFPVIVVTIGGVVAAVVMGMFLPIVSLITELSGRR